VLGIKGGNAKKEAASRPLEGHLSPSHITFVQATTSVSETDHWGCTHLKPGPMAGGLPKQSLNGGL